MEISCKFALYAMPLSCLWLLATQRMSDVHGVLSSRTLLSSCRLMPRASFMESLHLIFGLPLSLLPSIFSPQYCLFQRTQSSHDVPEIGQFHTIFLFPSFISIFFKSKTISSLLSRTVQPCQKLFNGEAKWISQIMLFKFYAISVLNQVYFTRVLFLFLFFLFILWLNKKDEVKKTIIFNLKTIFLISKVCFACLNCC